MSAAVGNAVGVSLPRVVLPELLDGLAADDLTAQRSRRDLQRVHCAMGTRGTVLGALRKLPLERASGALSSPLQVLELGSGDGTLMLGVAQALQSDWPAVAVTLLDRQPLLTAGTVADCARVGWTATAEVADALDWATATPFDGLALQTAPRWDLIVVNLFLHHFEATELALLLAAVAGSSQHFVACEPRRAWLALAGSHLIGAIGANAVTRHEAVMSVHTGFRGHELTARWTASASVSASASASASASVSPSTAAPGWKLSEHPAVLFSHCFVDIPTPAGCPVSSPEPCTTQATHGPAAAPAARSRTLQGPMLPLKWCGSSWPCPARLFDRRRV